MDLVLLPGNSLNNKQWIDEVKIALGPTFNKTRVLYYSHWQTGDSLIDFEKEQTALKALTQDLGDLVIFAKSAGCLLILKMISQSKLKPKKCIFVGAALLWGEAQGWEVKSWLKDFSIPTLFIQKSLDPAISFKDLENQLVEAKVQNYKLVEIPGDDHHYDDVTQLKNLVLEFVKN